LGSIIENITAQGTPESVAIVDALFPERIGRLKMTTEISPDLIFPLACLEVVAKRFKSKVLPAFSREVYLLEISKDRKGRVELVEGVLSTRRPIEED